MSRISTHIRQNVVGYVALFFALTGSAYALNRGEVRSKHIAKNAVTTPKIAKNAVKTPKIARNAVRPRHIAKDAVRTPKIADGAVTGAKLADGVAVSGPQGPPGPQGSQGPTGPPGPATGPAGGDLTGSYPDPTIAPQAVGTAKLADDAVFPQKLADSAVTNPKLATFAVTGAKVVPNTLTGTHVNEAALDYASAGCKTGLVHSFARIKGSSSMPTTYTTSSEFVDPAHNCAGGSVQIRRTATLPDGCCIFIRFNGDGAELATATSTVANRSIGVERIFAGPDAGAFRISMLRASTAGTGCPDCVLLNSDIMFMTF